jgi:TrmH family RNA methyltransferase
MAHTIFSRSNSRLKELLKQRNSYCFFEGEKLVKDILKKEIPISILIIHQSNQAEIPQIPIDGKNITEIWYVNDLVLSKICTLKEKPNLIAVLELEETGIDFENAGIIFALDNVQDPGNVGTIFRCASAFGIPSIAFSGLSIKLNNPKFLRAAQDSIFFARTERFLHFEDLVKKSKKEGYHIYLTSPGLSINTIDVNQIEQPCVIVMGNEGKGLGEGLFDRFPSVRVGQSKGVDSLNVGVCACILMHELKKLK